MVCSGGAHRTADRQLCVGVGESPAAIGRRVTVRCPDNFMVGTPNNIKTMLVRDDQQKNSHGHSDFTGLDYLAFQKRHPGGRENRARLQAPPQKMVKVCVTRVDA